MAALHRRRNTTECDQLMMVLDLTTTMLSHSKKKMKTIEVSTAAPQDGSALWLFL
jgi:hypothetical protein